MAKIIEQLRAAATAAAEALAKDPENAELKASAETAAEALAAAEAEAEAAKEKAAVKTTEVRILVDHQDYRVNQVVKLPADEVAAAKDAGWADDHPAAVKYAKSLAAK